MMVKTKSPPNMRGHLWGVMILAKFSTNIKTPAPTTGPRNVPRPPIIAMTMGKKEVAMPR
jgi:hypothetical protein